MPLLQDPGSLSDELDKLSPSHCKRKAGEKANDWAIKNKDRVNDMIERIPHILAAHPTVKNIVGQVHEGTDDCETATRRTETIWQSTTNQKTF